MRRKIGNIALVISLAFLASVLVINRASEKAILEANNKVLYYAHVLAIDSKTSRPIEFELHWNTDDISPDSKGSDAAVKESLSDGSVVFAAIGVRLKKPLRVEVTAEGYQSVFIDVVPQFSGIRILDSSGFLQTVALTSVNPVEEDPTDK